MTTKYTFKQEYEGFTSLNTSSPPSSLTMELNGDLNLTQILERFEEFLRGAGFHFEGYLDFVQDESDEKKDIVLDSSYPDGDGYWNGDNMGTMTLSFPDGTEEIVTKTTAHSDYFYDFDRNK